MTALTLTIDLPFLAGEVNSAHAEVQFHAKSMLLEAKRAGEALLKAKSLCRHGEFKAWVEANCRCSYSTAADYMKVARSWEKLGAHDFCALSIRQALALVEQPRPATAAPSFTKEDADYALKINAMAERGQGGEVDVAKAKLERLASGFGMTADQMVEKAKALCPEPVSMGPLDEALEQMMAPYRKLPKDTLVAALLKCFVTHPDLIDLLGKEMRNV